MRNIWLLMTPAFQSAFGMRKVVKYGFFSPEPHAIEYFKKLVDQKKVNIFVNNLYAD